MNEKPQCIFHVCFSNRYVARSQFAIQEGDQSLPFVGGGWNAHEPADEIINDLIRILQALIEDHACEIDLCRRPWNGFDSLDRHLPAAETAVACVEVLIAVGQHVRFRQCFGRASFRHRRGGNIQACADFIRHNTDVL